MENHLNGIYDSLKIITEDIARKVCDISFFRNRGSTIQKNTFIFGIENIEIGVKNLLLFLQILNMMDIRLFFNGL